MSEINGSFTPAIYFAIAFFFYWVNRNRNRNSKIAQPTLGPDCNRDRSRNHIINHRGEWTLSARSHSALSDSVSASDAKKGRVPNLGEVR